MSVRGQLGNQLFQWAMLRGLVPGQQVVVDDLWTTAAPLVAALRPGSLRLVTHREAARLRQPPRLRRPARQRVLARVERLDDGPAARWLHGREFRERTRSYDPAVAAVRPPVLYVGYFQQERYFDHVADKVRGTFRPPTGEVGAAQSHLHAAIGPGETVAVVVRAGPEYDRLGWTLPFDWYQRAATLMAERVERPRFLVFSDVTLAAEGMAAAFRDIGPAHAVEPLDALSHLHLIASMDHAIVSASSYAWWGAWLGDQQQGPGGGRIVIAPTPWLRDELAETPREQWLRLAVDGHQSAAPSER